MFIFGHKMVLLSEKVHCGKLLNSLFYCYRANRPQ